MQRPSSALVAGIPTGRADSFLNNLKADRYLYVLVAPAVVVVVLFNYLPMIGVVMAFQDYSPVRGFLRSPWVGLENFVDFFSAPSAVRVIRNSVLLSLYQLLWSFPVPILFALVLNEVLNRSYKKLVQTVSMLPYFMSNAIVISMAMLLLTPDENGAVNAVRALLFGAEPEYFMIDRNWFRPIYITTQIWQTTGFVAVFYIATIAGINPELYEAATIDGAGRLGCMRHVTLPSLVPAIAVLLIFNVGSLMNGTSTEKVLLLQNPLTYEVSMTIETYTYRRGLAIDGGIPQYSYATAVGLWQTVVNVLLLVGANVASGRFFGRRIF